MRGGNFGSITVISLLLNRYYRLNYYYGLQMDAEIPSWRDLRWEKILTRLGLEPMIWSMEINSRNQFANGAKRSQPFKIGVLMEAVR